MTALRSPEHSPTLRLQPPALPAHTGVSMNLSPTVPLRSYHPPLVLSTLAQRSFSLPPTLTISTSLPLVLSLTRPQVCVYPLRFRQYSYIPILCIGLLTITSAQFKALKNLNFKVGSQTYSLTPNAQIWPRSLNTFIGGSSGSIYLIVGDLGSNSGQGLDFINGYTFLERFYSVFDTTNKRVGFATTAFTTATTN